MRLRRPMGLFVRLKVFWWIYRDPRMPLWAKFGLTALALAYVIWPIDLIPMIPVIGWLDDLTVASVLLWLVTRAAPAVVRRQSWMRAGAAVEPAGTG
ncbi:MAG: DUF1232 domain-containing protein [Phycisphaeraceae bacterium]